ncbi:MAG: nickel-responsive transcriptional regulator NikR [Odoribacteraceae bacterium]|jgi:CopG family nickel-responsive transcriptional regulator|nr:nickel-responsive transcriptional regulator NikR [Odoribacteraceae bacterium]
MAVSRFSVSLENELLDALDDYVRANDFPNRSQAVRQLIERNTVERKWQCGNTVAGAIILVYAQQKRDLVSKITAVQQAFAGEILAVQHFHLSCAVGFDIFAVKGPAYRLTDLADKLIALKGVHHGKLVMTRADDVHPREKPATTKTSNGHDPG